MIDFAIVKYDGLAGRMPVMPRHEASFEWHDFLPREAAMLSCGS